MEDSKRERKGYVLILLLFLLLLVSIGYAFLTSSLKINGHSSIENARWDIHFANISSEKGVTPVKKATISKDGLYIKAKDGIIKVLEIQGENAKRMPTPEFLRGNRIEVVDKFE